MTGWSDVGLVLAGSAGPLMITLVTQRAARRDERERRSRDDHRGTQQLYAEFVASCTQVDADWADYAVFAPRTFEEERAIDEGRDGHYDELNLLAARLRLTAEPTVLAAAEELLGSIRGAQELGRASQRGNPDHEAWQAHRRDFVAARDGFLEAAKSALHGRRLGTAG